MLALRTGSSPASLDGAIGEEHLGAMLFLGGWSGGESADRAVSTALQARTTSAATGRVHLLVAADQEGGAVQQLSGPGFSRIPSALDQGALPSGTLRSDAEHWGAQLRGAGVNVDLAPVAGTVPASLGRRNGPIGRYDREYGHTPDTVGRSVTAVVAGLEEAGVTATLKHFPGLGRIADNTDTSATGITDPVMTGTDPYLRPFAEGIAAGAGLVMVSSARYPRIDPDNQAVFSRAVITGLLRERMGFGGVVISDDLAAVAVRAVSPAQRAVRFISAGGDIMLTTHASDAAPMLAAVAARARTDPAFAGNVDAAVRRVLTLKARMRLLPCSTS